MFGPLAPAPACCAAAAADGDPLWASGPASVALLVVPLTEVVVPVELFIRLCGSFAAADPLLVAPATVDGVAGAVPVVPTVPVVGAVPDDAAPVTGMHGADVGVGCVTVVPDDVRLPPCPAVPDAGCVPGCAVPAVFVWFWAAAAPAQSAAARAALLVIIANLRDMESLLFQSRRTLHAPFRLRAPSP